MIVSMAVIGMETTGDVLEVRPSFGEIDACWRVGWIIGYGQVGDKQGSKETNVYDGSEEHDGSRGKGEGVVASHGELSWSHVRSQNLAMQ